MSTAIFNKCLNNIKEYEKWWRGQDLNLCTLARAELQSAAINHSTTPPREIEIRISKNAVKAHSIKKGFCTSCQVRYDLNHEKYEK